MFCVLVLNSGHRVLFYLDQETSYISHRQIWQDTGVTGIDIQLCQCSNVECSNVPMFQCYNATMLQCYNVTMFQCSNVPVFQCSNVQIFECSNVQMFKCSNVQMFKYQLSERTSSHFLPSHQIVGCYFFRFGLEALIGHDLLFVQKDHTRPNHPIVNSAAKCR